jgi:mono/diheme cytochrome c family protein
LLLWLTLAAGLHAQNDAERAGAKLFQRHCASCHGTAAEGGKKAPSLTTKKVKAAAPAQLFGILRNGVAAKGMPSFARLPGQQREQIIAWLQRTQP